MYADRSTSGGNRNIVVHWNRFTFEVMMPYSKNLKRLPLGQNISYFLNFMWVNSLHLWYVFKTKYFKHSAEKKYFCKNMLHNLKSTNFKKEQPAVN